MKPTIWISTAVALVLGAASANAQDTPRNTTDPNFPPPGQATRPPTPKAAPATRSQSQSPPSAQVPAPSTQAQQQPGSQTTPSTSQAQPSSTPSTSQPASAQAPASSTPAPSSQLPASTAQTPATQSPTTAQSPQPSSAPAAAPSTQTGQAPAAAPAQQGAQAPQASPSAAVNLNSQQQASIGTAITQLNVAPLSNVNFAIAVGTTVPRSVRLYTVPTTIIQIAPQFRDHRFFLVRDEIVIVEPRTLRIVAVLPRSGARNAAAPDRAQRRVTLTTRERAVLRKQAEEPRRARAATTGSATETRIRVGDRLPDSIELRSFPDRTLRDVPSVREYRYITRERRIYLVDPEERTIIEEFD